MIDLIHDVGEAYRQLVNANSYPGNVYNVAPYVEKSIDMPDMLATTQLMCLMLLDAEVSFAVVGESSKDVVAFMTKFTYAKQTTVNKADFIFILKTASIQQKQEAVKQAQIGTLIDPHESATIICEVDSVTKGDGYCFSGPGIKDETRVNVSIFDQWNTILSEKNIEFPLGIELYLVDENDDIMALTRTTQVKGCEQ